MGNVVTLRTNATDLAEVEDESLNSIAAQCYDEAKGDTDRARNLVKRRLHRNPDLQQRLLNELVDTAVKTAVQSARIAEKTRIKRFAARPDDTSGLRAMAEATRSEMYLNYMLSDGTTKLRDANKAMLLSERERYFKQAAGAHTMGELMHYIARQLGPRQYVGAVLTEEQIAGFFHKFLG
jgi:hypothetical protein